MSALSGPKWPIDVREGDSALFAEFFSALRNLQTDFNEDKLTAFLRIVDGEIGSRKLKDRDAAVRLLSWLAIIIRNRFPDGVGGYNVLRIASALSAALVDLDNGVVGSIVAPTVRSHRSRDKLAIAVLKAGCLLVIEHRVASGVSRAEAERQILSRNGAMVSAFGAWG